MSLIPKVGSGHALWCQLLSTPQATQTHFVLGSLGTAPRFGGASLPKGPSEEGVVQPALGITHPRIPCADSPRPISARDLSIQGSVSPESWSQRPSTPEAQLWKEQQLQPLEMVSGPRGPHSQLPLHSAFIYSGPGESHGALSETFIYETRLTPQ